MIRSDGRLSSGLSCNGKRAEQLVTSAVAVSVPSFMSLFECVCDSLFIIWKVDL